MRRSFFRPGFFVVTEAEINVAFGLPAFGQKFSVASRMEIIVPFISCVPRPQMKPPSIVPPNGS